MPSSSLCPPPSTLHPRRHRASNKFQCLPSQEPPETSPCSSRKMTLSKGATFHVSSSPPTDDSPVLSIRHLARRSPTGSQSSLTSLLFEKEDDAARSLQDFERTFSGARGRQHTHRQGLEQVAGQRPVSISALPPSDEGLGPLLATRGRQDLTKPFERGLDQDSGLGSSIGSETIKVDGARADIVPSEYDSRSVDDLIQADVVQKDRKLTQSRLISRSGSSVLRSISPMVPGTSQPANLSKFARKRFSENILQPILQEDRFRIFHPLVSTLFSKTNQTIKCLRDLEQSLIFEPLVSTTCYPKDKPTHANAFVFLPKGLAITRNLYRSFGEFSVQLVLDTFHHLSEPEQRRASDRPYDNGYFLDLVQQVGRLAAQVGASRGHLRGEASEATRVDEMECSLDDEITLEGGLGQTGQPAELVRWRNGAGISLRTNQRYEAHPRLKRQRSNGSPDDAAERSMARPKKNAEPRIIELKCPDHSCEKVFKRKCDLAKHHKTHSRPFKCPDKNCKYHEEGLAGEKELDRHVNDRHSTNPRYFRCQFCPFQTKRESNCKQHMEKKHGWAYDRVKCKAKSKKTLLQTPQTPSMLTPNASDSGTSSFNYDDDINSTPHSTPLNGFDGTTPPIDPYSRTLFPPVPSTTTVLRDDAAETGHRTNLYGHGYMSSASENPTLHPYVNESSFFETRMSPPYSTGHNLNATFPKSALTGAEYHVDGPENSNASVSGPFKPHSKNPSISEFSPMALHDGFFPPCQQVINPPEIDMLNSPVPAAGLPSHDFALYASSEGQDSTALSAGLQSFEQMDLDIEFQLGPYMNI